MMNLFQNGGTKTQKQQLPKTFKPNFNKNQCTACVSGASRNRSEQGSVLAVKRSRTRVRPVRRSGASQAGNVPAQ
jgi:hypothetical protein